MDLHERINYPEDLRMMVDGKFTVVQRAPEIQLSSREFSPAKVRTVITSLAASKHLQTIGIVKIIPPFVPRPNWKEFILNVPPNSQHSQQVWTRTESKNGSGFCKMYSTKPEYKFGGVTAEMLASWLSSSFGSTADALTALEGLDQQSPATYFVNVNANIYSSKSANQWSLDDLNTPLSYMAPSPGINTVQVYFGEKCSTFAVHTEDYELYSINQLNGGAPKLWLTVAPEDYHRFRDLVSTTAGSKCPNFVRSKNHIVPTSSLLKSGIKFTLTEQRVGDIVLVFSHSHHQGVNLGCNLASAVNVAPPQYFDEIKELAGPKVSKSKLTLAFGGCHSGQHGEFNLEFFKDLVTTSKELDQHVEVMAAKKKCPESLDADLQCPTCLKRFSRKNLRDRHLRENSKCGETKQRFLCEICQKSFGYKNGLVQHSKTHMKPSTSE